jgi:hypothetical protein
VVIAAVIALVVMWIGKGGSPRAAVSPSESVTTELGGPTLEPVRRPSSMKGVAPVPVTPDGGPELVAATVVPPIQKEKDRDRDRDKDRARDRDRDKDKDRARKGEDGFLTIDVSPWSDVILDGENIGSTPVVKRKVSPGKHSVTLVGRDEGYRMTFSVKVESGREKVEKRTLGKGQLACDAEPWADVYAGGRRLGTTPLAPVSMTEGTYTLRLANPQLKKEKTVKVQVRAGKVTRVKEKLE